MAHNSMKWLWHLLLDIRTERMLRFCGAYAASLCCYFLWSGEIHPHIRLQTVLGVRDINTVFVPSTHYWGVLLAFGCVPIATQYSMGFQLLLVQMLVIACTITGIILSFTIPAVKESLWAGYLVIATAFTILVGPAFLAVEPALMHLFAMATAIMVEFIYTPFMEYAHNNAQYVRDLVNVTDLWKSMIQVMMVNLGMFAGIVVGVMLLPPWRSARVHLHERAARALRVLATSFNAVGSSLLDAHVSAQVLAADGDERVKPESVAVATGDAEIPVWLKPLPNLSLEMLLSGLSRSKDSIEDLASLSMLEPSLLHPGTFSAMPEAWQHFVVVLREVYSQAELLHRSAPLLHRELPPGHEARQLAGEAALAAGRVAEALARCTELEHRGKRDYAVLDYNAFLVGFSKGRREAAARQREQLQSELEAALQQGQEAVHKLGSMLLATAASVTPESDGSDSPSDGASLLPPAASASGLRDEGISADARAHRSAVSAAEVAVRLNSADPAHLGPSADPAHAADDGTKQAGSNSSMLPAAAGATAPHALENNALRSPGNAEHRAGKGSGSTLVCDAPPFAVAVFVTLSIVLRRMKAPNTHTAGAARGSDASGGKAHAASEGKQQEGTHGTADGTEGGAEAEALAPNGLAALEASLQAINKQLRTTSPSNIAKQLVISCGPYQLVAVLKCWAKGMIAVLKLPFAWRESGPQYIWRQPIHICYGVQFVVGVWALFAALTFWNNYRNWENTDGHGGTWPLMAFLLVLQPTQEATLQKAVLRMVVTAIAVLIAWGIHTANSSPGFLIPISALIVAPAFWLLPDSRSRWPLRRVGDLQYVCVAYTFCYTVVMADSGQYGARATAVTRLGSQVLGCVVAGIISLIILPVSGVATAASAGDEALSEMGLAASRMAAALRGAPAQDADTLGGAHATSTALKPVAQQDTKGGSSSPHPWLSATEEHLERAEEASRFLRIQMASLRAFPLLDTLMGGMQTSQLQQHLGLTSFAVARKVQLLRYACRDVQQLAASCSALAPVTPPAKAGAQAEVFGDDRQQAASVMQAVAAELDELTQVLETQRVQLRVAYGTRCRLLPHMPVHFAPLTQTLDGGGAADPERPAGADDGKARVSGHGWSPDVHEKVSPSLMELHRRLRQGLHKAVVGRPWAQVEGDLRAYMAGEEGTGLAQALGRFGLAYHLYTARLTSLKLHKLGVADDDTDEDA